MDNMDRQYDYSLICVPNVTSYIEIDILLSGMWNLTIGSYVSKKANSVENL